MTDPLGLTDEQRAQSDLYEFVNGIPARIERNRAWVEALPPGMPIRITLFGSAYPEMTREQVLGVML